jgi:hypothetical protein
MKFSWKMNWALICILLLGYDYAQKSIAGGFQGTVQVITRKFNGKIGNLTGDGKVQTINSECRGFGRGPTKDGKYFTEFDLTPSGPTNPPAEFHVYFIFPDLSTRQTLITNTESQAVDVWLFRSDANYSNIVCVIKGDQELLHQRGGEKMTGRVAIKWNSDSDFVIGADLTLARTNSTWLRGEFVGDSRTKLNPILYDWPAVLLFQESK